MYKLTIRGEKITRHYLLNSAPEDSNVELFIKDNKKQYKQKIYSVMSINISNLNTKFFNHLIK